MSSKPLLPRPRKLLTMLDKSIQAPVLNSEIQAVLKAYALGLPRLLQRPAAAATRSRSYVLQFDDNKRVLKRYKSSMLREAVLYEHAVLDHLAARRFPAPQLVPTRERQTIVEHNDRLFALFEHIDGFCYSDYVLAPARRRDFLEQTGRMLARLHRAMADATPAGIKVDGFTPDGKRRWQDVTWFSEQLARYRERLPREVRAPSSDRNLIAGLASIQAGLAPLFTRLAEWDDRLTKVIIHGDYGPHNILFDDGRIAAVLDFECAHLDYRITDIVSAVLFSSNRKVGFDPLRAAAFLAAYQAVWPLSAHEVKAAPDALLLLIVRRLLNRLRDYGHDRRPAALRRVSQLADQYAWFERHRRELADVFPQSPRGQEESEG